MLEESFIYHIPIFIILYHNLLDIHSQNPLKEYNTIIIVKSTTTLSYFIHKYQHTYHNSTIIHHSLDSISLVRRIHYQFYLSITYTYRNDRKLITRIILNIHLEPHFYSQLKYYSIRYHYSHYFAHSFHAF